MEIVCQINYLFINYKYLLFIFIICLLYLLSFLVYLILFIYYMYISQLLKVDFGCTVMQVQQEMRSRVNYVPIPLKLFRDSD